MVISQVGFPSNHGHLLFLEGVLLGVCDVKCWLRAGLFVWAELLNNSIVVGVANKELSVGRKLRMKKYIYFVLFLAVKSSVFG